MCIFYTYGISGVFPGTIPGTFPVFLTHFTDYNFR